MSTIRRSDAPSATSSLDRSRSEGSTAVIVKSNSTGTSWQARTSPTLYKATLLTNDGPSTSSHMTLMALTHGSLQPPVAATTRLVAAVTRPVAAPAAIQRKENPRISRGLHQRLWRKNLSSTSRAASAAPRFTCQPQLVGWTGHRDFGIESLKV